LIKEAVFVHASRARTKGEAAVQRAEILRLRFREGMPIREIVSAWNADSTYIHNQYSQARKEFKKVLMEILALEYSHAGKELEKVLSELRSVLNQ
jgi:hypothetical protein